MGGCGGSSREQRYTDTPALPYTVTMTHWHTDTPTPAHWDGHFQDPPELGSFFICVLLFFSFSSSFVWYSWDVLSASWAALYRPAACTARDIYCLISAYYFWAHLYFPLYTFANLSFSLKTPTFTRYGIQSISISKIRASTQKLEFFSSSGYKRKWKMTFQFCAVTFKFLSKLARLHISAA